MGRPRVAEVSDEFLRQVEGLGKLRCVEIEAAAFLKISQPTFNRLLNNNKKVREAWDSGNNLVNLSLRRWQFKSAEGGNVTMQIWLGKQYLDQKDKHEVAGDPNNPIKHSHSFGWMTKEQAEARGWA